MNRNKQEEIKSFIEDISYYREDIVFFKQKIKEKEEEIKKIKDEDRIIYLKNVITNYIIGIKDCGTWIRSSKYKILLLKNGK